MIVAIVVGVVAAVAGFAAGCRWKSTSDRVDELVVDDDTTRVDALARAVGFCTDVRR